MTKALLLTAAFLLGSPSFALAAVGTATESEQQAQQQQEQVSRVVSWIKAAGGSVDVGRQEVRRERPGRSPGPRGVFATDSIPKGEVLASVPWDLIITESPGGDNTCNEGEGCAKNDDDEAGKLCPTVRALANELAKDEMTPYAQLLIDPLADPSIPETWSEAGRMLFDEVLGTSGAIGPQNYAGLYRGLWRDLCKGDADDAVADRALFLTVTRSREVSAGVGLAGTQKAMIPFLDLYNHKNGRYSNVDIIVAVGEKELRAVSTRNIRKGDQLYVSYGSNTALILRDYGFVEFPQRWRFDFSDNHVVEFNLDAGADGDLRPEWIIRPDGLTVDLMEKEMNRLQLVEADLYTASRKQAKMGEMSKAELDAIWKYQGALVNAMDHSIIEARGRKAKIEL